MLGGGDSRGYVDAKMEITFIIIVFSKRTVKEHATTGGGIHAGLGSYGS